MPVCAPQADIMSFEKKIGAPVGTSHVLAASFMSAAPAEAPAPAADMMMMMAGDG